MVNNTILSQVFNQNALDIDGPTEKDVDEKKRTEQMDQGVYTLEEAIKTAGHGKFHIFILFVCGFGLMGVVVENVNVGFIMPYLRCDMHLTTTEQGLMNSAGYIGILIASHFWGFLADTWGRQKVLRVALLGSFLNAVLSAFSVNILMMYITRFLVGCCVAGVQATTYSYIGEFHSNKTRTQAASFVAMFMPICFVYLPTIAYFVMPMQWEFYLLDLKITPWRFYLLCSSLINGVNFICLSFLPESPKFLLSMNKKEETLTVLKQIYSINTGKDKETFPVKDLYQEEKGTNLSEVNGFGSLIKLFWNQTWPLFRSPHLKNTVTLCYLMFILFSIGHGTFMWFPDFLTQMQEEIHNPITLCQGLRKHNPNAYLTMANETENSTVAGVCEVDNSNTLAFQIIFMMGTSFVIISAIVSYFIDKVDRKILLTVWLFFTSVVGISILFVNQFYIMAICFILFLSCGLCGGIISAISVALYPTNYRAMATCIILNLGRAGAVAGSNFVGFLLENSCEMIFYVYSGLILSCVLIVIFFNTNPDHKASVAPKKKSNP